MGRLEHSADRAWLAELPARATLKLRELFLPLGRGVMAGCGMGQGAYGSLGVWVLSPGMGLGCHGGMGPGYPLRYGFGPNALTPTSPCQKSLCKGRMMCSGLATGAMKVEGRAWIRTIWGLPKMGFEVGLVASLPRKVFGIWYPLQPLKRDQKDNNRFCLSLVWRVLIWK